MPQKDALWTKYHIMPEKVFTIRQVHGNKVLAVFSQDIPQTGDLPEADAVVTNVAGVVLSVRTADCLPVFLYDSKQKCIGLAHAGWKGTQQKIVAKTVEALEKYYGSHPGHIQAQFGPAIRRCCYEVGPEFEKIFPDGIAYIEGQRCLDLSWVNRNQLLDCGVQKENIFIMKECTCCGTDYFSYRRDREKAGRHLSLLVRNGES